MKTLLFITVLRVGNLPILTSYPLQFPLHQPLLQSLFAPASLIPFVLTVSRKLMRLISVSLLVIRWLDALLRMHALHNMLLGPLALVNRMPTLPCPPLPLHPLLRPLLALSLSTGNLTPLILLGQTLLPQVLLILSKFHPPSSYLITLTMPSFLLWQFLISLFPFLLLFLILPLFFPSLLPFFSLLYILP